MKQVDRLTVVISSITLLLFCLCSYWLLSQYSNIQDQVINKTDEEVRQIEQTLVLLASDGQIDRAALADQLTANKRALQVHQNEWQLLKTTLGSFVSILVVIVFSHLFFVFTLFRAMRR